MRLTSTIFNGSWLNGLLPGFRRSGFGQNVVKLWNDVARLFSENGKISVSVSATASASRSHQKFFPEETVVADLKVTIPVDDAGGTISVTINRVAANGTRTALASSVNIGAASPRVPFAVTGLDLPFTLAATESLELVTVGGAGLSAPLEVGFHITLGD